MKRVGVALVMALVSVAAMPSQSGEDATAWKQLTDRLERASMNGAVAELRAIRTELLRSLSQPASKEREHLLQYAVAYVAWRMAFQPGVTEKEQSDLLEDGVKRLREVVRVDTRNAEAFSLLSGLYGAQVGKSPMKGMTLGPRASSAGDSARELQPENPRVLVQQGIGAFNTPAMFGGGIDKADGLLRKSLELFAKEPVDKPWPNWGRFDAHVWLGQVLQKKGDRAGARAQYDLALALAPESGWVKYSLLPALQRTR